MLEPINEISSVIYVVHVIYIRCMTNLITIDRFGEDPDQFNAGSIDQPNYSPLPEQCSCWVVSYGLIIVFSKTPNLFWLSYSIQVFYAIFSYIDVKRSWCIYQASRYYIGLILSNNFTLLQHGSYLTSVCHCCICFVMSKLFLIISFIKQIMP